MILTDLPPLTSRQQQVLDLIHRAITQTGAPPTRAEIAQQLGFRSINAAEDHLKALAKKGVIELMSGTSRGIRLKAATLAALAPEAAANAMDADTIHLPLVGRVAAGSPILAQEHVEKSYAVQAVLFHQRPDYLLKVRGMSMRDAGILDGDLLAVRSTQEARSGQIVVARLGDEVTVKRFQRKPHSIELHAENPEFKTIVVQAGEAFAIEGLAVGLIRNGL